MVEVLIPKYLQHLNDIHINHWYYEEGDRVVAQSNLLEVTSEEGAVIIPVPVNGVLDEVLLNIGDYASVDDIVGIIEEVEKEKKEFLLEK